MRQLGKATTFWLEVAGCVFHPVRSKDSLISNKTGKNQFISVTFCMEIIIKGRWHQRQPVLIECGQVSLLANQILVFVDNQNLWKELITLSDYCHFFRARVHLVVTSIVKTVSKKIGPLNSSMKFIFPKPYILALFNLHQWFKLKNNNKLKIFT